MLYETMSWIAILISIGLFAVIVGVAYWFAAAEQKAMKPGADDLDEQTREARRRASSSITNVGGGS